MQKFFSESLVIDNLPPKEQYYKMSADAQDCEKIKEILQIPGVKSFVAEMRLKYDRKSHSLLLWGNVEAELELESVISMTLFVEKYNNEFDLKYDTKATLKSQHEEEEIRFDDDTPEIIVNGELNLTDTAIEQIALVMDDYPRKKGEAFEFKAEFSPEEEKKNPFEILKKLR